MYNGSSEKTPSVDCSYWACFWSSCTACTLTDRAGFASKPCGCMCLRRAQTESAVAFGVYRSRPIPLVISCGGGRVALQRIDARHVACGFCPATRAMLHAITSKPTTMYISSSAPAAALPGGGRGRPAPPCCRRPAGRLCLEQAARLAGVRAAAGRCRRRAPPCAHRHAPKNAHCAPWATGQLHCALGLTKHFQPAEDAVAKHYVSAPVQSAVQADHCIQAGLTASDVICDHIRSATA